MHTTTWRRAIIGALALTTAGIALAVTAPSANAVAPLLHATLLDTSGNRVGEVTFQGRHATVTRVAVRISASAAPALGDFHGFHIHTTGACDPTPSGSTNVPFGSAGGHWNPTAATHGGHSGDLPSPLIQANGKAILRFDTDRIAVSSLMDADGSAVVLHAGRDNFANIPAAYASGEPPVAGPNAATLGTGDAGGRFACGVVQPIA